VVAALPRLVARVGKHRFDGTPGRHRSVLPSSRDRTLLAGSAAPASRDQRRGRSL